MSTRSALSTLCFLLATASASAQTVWYVDDDNCPGPGSGNEGDPFCKIQDGIDASASGDEVVVADGTYTGDGNRDLDFAGRLITVRSANGPDHCIIDPQGSGIDPHRGFYFHNGETDEAEVQGFTITGGNHFSGGGIYNVNSSPTVRNCIFSGNFARYTGGGMHTVGAPTVIGCTFTGNVASIGGGIYSSFGSLTITNCVVSQNSAESGGGMMFNRSNPTVTNCSITGNSSQNYAGGGVRCVGTTLTINNCILWHNEGQNGPELAGTNWYTDIPPFQVPSMVSVTYCDVEGGEAAVYVEDGSKLTWGDGNIDALPDFAFADDPHLMPGSPCIDVGTNAPPGGLPGTDADGNARPLDGDGDGSLIADMGAYEFNMPVPSIALSPAAVEFFAPESGSNPDDQLLLIRNCGGGTLGWEIAEGCFWLEANPVSGDSSGEIDEVLLAGDAGGLSHGDYHCLLTVSGNQAVNSPRSVAVTLHVNTTLNVPTQYATIQSAIEDAVQGDVVLVADGLYTGPGNKNLDFRGKLITVRSENGPDNCIIDCQNSGRGFYFQSGETAAAIVEGFTVRNGSSPLVGGAIYCVTSSPTINNCTISGSSADYGGGIRSSSGSPVISNCTITGNSAHSGSGIYCAGGRPTITNCTINGNSTDSSWGGAVLIDESNATISKCMITGNSAAATGTGGIHIAAFGAFGATISQCTISGNTAYLAAGGIRSRGRTTITDSVISENSTTGSGGGIACGEGTIITNCTITGNSSGPNGFGGGGIYALDSTTIINCRISANSTLSSGGGIFCHHTPTIKNCTITLNSAASLGGGILCRGTGYTDVMSSNCILWGNDAPVGPEIALVNSDYGDPATLTVRYCDVEGGQAAAYVEEGSELIWGEGNIESDPLFVDPPNGDFHLPPLSPCLDAGNNDAVPQDAADLDGDGDVDEATPFDLDGNPRFVNDLDTQDTGLNEGGCPIVDLGAYEFQEGTTECCPANFNGDGAVNASDLAQLLGAWGPNPDHPADLDGDGEVGPFDLAILLGVWGPCL